MKHRSNAISLLLISTAFAANAALAEEPTKPISPVQNINLAQVELGKKLYNQSPLINRAE